jgi:hypothetical protein
LIAQEDMPTILRVGPYRFFFYGGDRDEPEHIHVERDDNVAKFWLIPIRLQSSGGFTRREIKSNTSSDRRAPRSIGGGLA